MTKQMLAGMAGVAAAALVAGSPALAADLGMPTKAPIVAPAPYFSWTGCYAGAHVGWGWGRSKFSDQPGFSSIDFAGAGRSVDNNISGAAFGGQVGCNYQFASNWVVGVEGAFSAADINGTAVDQFAPLTIQSKTDWFGSATARLGVTWGQVMLYAKGGAAWEHSKNQLLFNFPPNGTADFTRSGWTVGGGLEWAANPNWSMFLEYGHYFFGTATPNAVFPGAAFTTPINVKQDLDTVKLGVNYHFVGAPVSARY